MKRRIKRIVGLMMATVMSTSLLSTAAMAETAKAPENLKNDNLLRLWYTKEADQGDPYGWQTQALAIGNGYMGGLVYGGVAKDKIHLNEKTIWKGGPSADYDYKYGNTNPTATEEDLQKIKDDLDAIRKKLDDKSEYVFGFSEDSYVSEGTNTKGEAMDWLNKMMGDLTGYSSPSDYASIYLTNNSINQDKVENYVRDLDMRTALSTVNYDYEGVHYTREYFNSYPDNILVVRLTANKKGKINFNTNLESVPRMGAGEVSVEDNTITLKNTLPDNGLKVESQLKIFADGGKTTTDGRTIDIKNADSATLVLACGTDYKMEMPTFRGEDPHAAVTSRIENAESILAKDGYDELKKRHVDDHSSLFSRLELNFNEEIPQIPTDELITKYRNMVDNNGGDVPTESEQRALEIMCYQFGRYLTIAGSREGGLPTNLQGVWGEGGFTWYGDYHFNINVQMNYWPTMASNLAECHVPYNDFLNELKVAGRESAASAFGIKSNPGEENGWLVGCFSTPYLFSALGQKNNAAGWNPIGSAWALLNSYEYYLYTGDQEYLKNELYPSMKEIANFWNEALYWSEYQQRYVSAPSYSPENGPIVNGASYDQQFIWQHFENTIEAAKTLGVDAELVAQWEEKQSKLNPVLVGESKQIKEWYEETTFGHAKAGDLKEIKIPQWRESLGAQSQGEQPPHRHLSHLMALYPGNLINKDNSEFMDAAIVSLEERGLDATGWSKAHKQNLWARTGRSEEAFKIVQSAVGGGNSGFLTNMFSSHGGGANYKQRPIFQIDGNFGYTAGVNEMLLQSQLGYVQFLPALPKEWNTGYVNGMVARGNFVVDMKWTDGVAEAFKITSRNGGEFTAEYADLSSYTVKDSKGNVVATSTPNGDKNKISFATTAEETYIISKADTHVVSVNNTENGSVAAPSIINDGKEATFTVSPQFGYEIESVSVLDASGKPVELKTMKDARPIKYSFIMPGSNVTIHTTFKAIDPEILPYTISYVKGENGSVEGAVEEYPGKEVNLTIKPNKGYEVDKLIVQTFDEQPIECIKKDNGTYTFTMTERDVVVNATFKKSQDSSKPDAKPDTKPEDNTNGKPDGKPDIKPEDNTNGKPDGKPDAKPDSKPDKKPGNAPITGDSSHVGVWVVLGLASVISIIAVILSKRKKFNK